MATQYRYSKASFQRSVLTAIGLTIILSFLVWLFARLFGFRHAELITLISGLLFFGFCSAAMIWQFINDQIVLAFRPDGFFDARYSLDAVPWEDIKDLRLSRAENDFELNVYLWPRQQTANEAEPSFSVDLAPLDAGVEHILEALSVYRSITLEQVN